MPILITIQFIFQKKKKLEFKNTSNWIIITDKINLDFPNILKIKFPLKISKLIEKINIQVIKFKAKEKSNIQIGKYILDTNSRKLILNSNKINLTEKEVNLVLFLKNSSKPVNIQKLQVKVWGYKNSLESHTVETHIHRLRKKILTNLNSSNLILSNKNGYFLNKSSENIQIKADYHSFFIRLIFFNRVWKICWKNH